MARAIGPMNLALDDNQQLIRASAESFLQDASTSAAVRAAMESEAGFDAAVWQRIGRELGWCGVAIAEAHGGLGLGPVELALIFEQCGRRLLCSPLFATVALGANLLQQVARDDVQAELLPQVAAGELALSAPVTHDAGDWVAAGHGVGARASRDGWVLDGSVRGLPEVTPSSTLLVFAQAPDGLGLFALPAAATRVTTARGWDGTRRFSQASLAGVAARRIDDPARVAAGLARSAALARLLVAAEQLGGAQQCLDLTVDYVATRKQFGRTIASFQAVKHRCAQIMVEVEALRSAVYGVAAMAAGAEASSDAIARECCAVKALASDAFFFCAQEAIQLHGGVGFTWEYDPHLYFKRAQAGSHWFGTASALRERVAAGLLEQAA